MTEENKELLQAMQSMFTTLNEKIDGVKMHMENVTDKNIQILVDGHMQNAEKLAKLEKDVETLQFDMDVVRSIAISSERKMQNMKKVL